jgi:hypothetical protein
VVVSVPSVGIGAVVGAHVTPGLAIGPYASLGRGRDRSRRGARVGRFDDVMGARVRRKPALSLRRLNS